jgi:histidinol-phosphate aminotransferase
LNRAAQLAAIASLGDVEALQQRVRRIRLERGRMYRQLRKLNLLQPYSSAAPFLLCRMTRGTSHLAQRHLQDDGILVKGISDRWLANHLRIGIGLPEDTNRLMSSLKALAGNAEL